MLKKRGSLLIIAFLIITTGVSLLVLQGQTTKPKETVSKIRDTFPVVEYSSQSLLENEKQKSEKYNKGLEVLSSDIDISKDIEGVSYLHWDRGLTALPVEKSDVVILGKVVDAKAHLSANKNTVFSEFKIEIENVFKNSSQQEFENGNYIRAEREGGVVRYPSGYKFWYHVSKQQMPIVDGRYVFFLTNDFPIYGHYEQDFYLLTAYELRKGQVIPLDNPNESHPIVSVYKGKDQSVLLNDLQNVL